MYNATYAPFGGPPPPYSNHGNNYPLPSSQNEFSRSIGFEGVVQSPTQSQSFNYPHRGQPQYPSQWQPPPVQPIYPGYGQHQHSYPPPPPPAPCYPVPGYGYSEPTGQCPGQKKPNKIKSMMNKLNGTINGNGSQPVSTNQNGAYGQKKKKSKLVKYGVPAAAAAAGVVIGAKLF